MWHAAKKRAFRVQATRDASLARSSESEHLRHQLHHIGAQLRQLQRMTRASSALWLRVVHNQRDFSWRVHESYPNRDGLWALCATLRADTTQLGAQFARQSTRHSEMLTHVRAQLGEYVRLIGGVESKYGRVDAAHAEMLRYRRKVDALLTATPRRGVLTMRVGGGGATRDEAQHEEQQERRKQRNLDKLQHAEAQHQRLVDDVLPQQRRLFGVHATLFHAALVAFWACNASCMDALVRSLRPARRFAEAEVGGVRLLDVKALVDGADGTTAVSVHAGISQFASDGDGRRFDVACHSSRSSSSSSSSSSCSATAAVVQVHEVHEVHHVMSGAAKDKASGSDADVSPTGVQQLGATTGPF
ncbi:unnamed protein product [Agarophyton chilense]|eukprot:gb/GEZJ01000233.1/.p1 GENE.gb/GEZJ01000233.1/~~gb/GEZJ01000233.1/.p1  ORF type:complete len:359 (-),score=45.50 gb/GEZJ01000233.1/:3246-4322(-)